MMLEASSSQSRRRDWVSEKPQGFGADGWVLAGITALAAVLRFWHLGAASLWLDEAASWVIRSSSAQEESS